MNSGKKVWKERKKKANRLARMLHTGRTYHDDLKVVGDTVIITLRDGTIIHARIT